MITILLAAAMAATMSVSAAAVLPDPGSNVVDDPVTNTSSTELTDNPSKGKEDGNYTIGVNGTYQEGTAADEKISVDIAWEGMEFTYTAGDSTYSPSDHKTTTADGTWSTDKGSVTVKNHSNAAIDATLSFTAAAGDEVTGTFYTKGDDETYTAIENVADQKLQLASALGTARNDENATEDKTPKGTLYFGITGGSITADESGKTLGTITVNIAKQTATTTPSGENEEDDIVNQELAE